MLSPFSWSTTMTTNEETAKGRLLVAQAFKDEYEVNLRLRLGDKLEDVNPLFEPVLARLGEGYFLLEEPAGAAAIC